MILLRTDLSIDECVTRLQIALAPTIGLPRPNQPAQPLVGQIHRWSFEARKHRLYTHNMFEPIFYGTLRTEGNGTIITGTFRIQPVVIIFLILGVMPFFYAAITTRSWVPVSTVPVMFGIIMVFIVASLPNQAYIRGHLLQILEASEIV